MKLCNKKTTTTKKGQIPATNLNFKISKRKKNKSSSAEFRIWSKAAICGLCIHLFG
jgi:hypothetical protein